MGVENPPAIHLHSRIQHAWKMGKLMQGCFWRPDLNVEVHADGSPTSDADREVSLRTAEFLCSIDRPVVSEEIGGTAFQ